MSLSDCGEAVNTFMQSIGKQGAFALGTVFGAAGASVITYYMHKLASQNNQRRLEIDLEREKVLHGQLKLKDERINALHDQVGKLTQMAAKKK
jgi:hypothetical protein